MGLSALALTGCGSPSIGDIQKQITSGLNGQLQQGSQTATYKASVSCPHNASLKTGSAFYCDATITNEAQPGHSTTRKVMVTIESSNRAHWVLQ